VKTPGLCLLHTISYPSNRRNKSTFLPKYSGNDTVEGAINPLKSTLNLLLELLLSICCASRLIAFTGLLFIAIDQQVFDDS